MARTILLIIFLLFGIMNCNKLSTDNDIVGTWVMRDSSRKHLPVASRKAPAEIILNTNRTFIASNIPGLLYVDPPGILKLDTGSGVWSILTLESGDRLQLEFRTSADGKKVTIPFGTQFFVSKGLSTVSLYYYIGDPDEGRKIEFYKVTPQ